MLPKQDLLQLLQRFTHKGNRLTLSNFRNEDRDMLRYLVDLNLIAIERYKSGSRPGLPRAYVLTDLGQESVAEFETVPISTLDWTMVHQATSKYGSLGLRTASQIAFGDAHRLEGYRNSPKLSQLNIWHQPDINPPAGTNLVRVAGKMYWENRWHCYKECWRVPGHFLWDWDMEQLQVRAMGQRLILVENPYAMWELMRRWQDSDVTLACIHGETLHTVELDSVFCTLLKHIYQAYPNLDTWIWCDPDFAGLEIATKTHELVRMLGGHPQFWLMDETILDQLTEIVLADTKLCALDEGEFEAFRHTVIHPDLNPLAAVIQERKQKGEQEALVVTVMSV